MQAVQEIQALLFEELSLIIRTTGQLLSRISAEHWEQRPQENMRTLRELAQHLVAIPEVDLLILRESPAEPVRALEAEIEASTGTDAARLTARFESGAALLQDYMNALSDDEFLHKATAPFYVNHPTVQAKWLIEIITHAQHHRAQLFDRMKLLGYPVSMSDLY
ncbi:DinB family protein [Paenibacillus spiritus]|uniref:DinB family protein n=1 Tax=Paenibacillus spiritus TaxID=2496557 RepID=A0A5J5FW92_9BACL|nr:MULTISPECIES: DinB family protein [Paenibacillus]KAA8997926.1 DinB family protein [Paenibacillus spiritus]